MDVAERLVGTYRLLSMTHFTEDGEEGHPFGLEPRGFAVYTREGYMSAILMRSGRPNFRAGDILGGDPDEKLDAYLSASAYAGPYEIVGDEIVHHLEATTYPNWTDSEQRRSFELTDTHFTLFPPKMIMEGKIRWGRVHFARIT